MTSTTTNNTSNIRGTVIIIIDLPEFVFGRLSGRAIKQPEEGLLGGSFS